MCDPVEAIVDVGLNVVTGGLYSLAKAGIETIETGSLSPLLTQGMDLGLASVGNQLSTDIGGPIAGQAFNAAGGIAGAAGGFASGIGMGTGGFGAAAGEEGAANGLTIGSEMATEGGTAGNSFTNGTAYTGEVGAMPQGADSATAIEAAAKPTSSLAAQSNPGLLETSGSDISGMNGGNWGLSAEDLASVKQAAANIQNGGDVAKEVGGMSPAVTSALALGGTMAGGQMLSGLFQGLSAQKQLELQQLINSQNQAQRQYLNKNNSTAPLLKFKNVPGPAGLLSTAGVK